MRKTFEEQRAFKIFEFVPSDTVRNLILEKLPKLLLSFTHFVYQFLIFFSPPASLLLRKAQGRAFHFRRNKLLRREINGLLFLCRSLDCLKKAKKSFRHHYRFPESNAIFARNTKPRSSIKICSDSFMIEEGH